MVLIILCSDYWSKSSQLEILYLYFHCSRARYRKKCKDRKIKKSFRNLNANTWEVSALLRSASQNKFYYKEALRERGMCLWVYNLISNIFSSVKYEAETNDNLLTSDSSYHTCSVINEEGDVRMLIHTRKTKVGSEIYLMYPSEASIIAGLILNPQT